MSIFVWELETVLYCFLLLLSYVIVLFSSKILLFFIHEKHTDFTEFNENRL